MSEFDEDEFRGKVERALSKARTVLDNERLATYPSDVAHKYQDKFMLANVVTSLAIGAQASVLEAIGLNGKVLRKMRQWVAAKKTVTMRLKSEERCTFDREVKREEEAATKHVREYAGVGTITDKVVTTVTDYYWRYEVAWEVVAIAGSGEGEDGDREVVQSRTARCEIKTGTNKAPRVAVRVRDAVDVNVTWLVQQVDEEGKVGFSIRRESKECKTPRRNEEVEKATQQMEDLERWYGRVKDYFWSEVFPVDVGHGLDMGRMNADSVFMPVVPVFDRALNRQEDAEGGGVEQGLVGLKAFGDGPTLRLCDLSRFLAEERRTLSEKMGEMARMYPERADRLVTTAEANVVVACKHGEEVSQYFVAGVDFIEDMLRQQVIGAIGKIVRPEDFAEYMVFHNRKIFKEEYAPQAFCYAVKRPDHYPEGIVSLEAKGTSGGMAQPIQTLAARHEMKVPMQFALGAGAKVSMSGEAYVHGYVMHEFEGEKAESITLSLRARQFSSFLVLVGRIVGPGLLDPQYGVLVQNKDEVIIPLDLETIPSAGEFKAAVVSISPEMQAFAKMYRGMQLASTLFGVCVLQIKPQMEKLLRLTNEALTKEIRLTQDLMELFVQYQIPSDLLSYGGSEDASRDERLEGVKRNVRAVRWMIDWAKLKELEEAFKVEEKALLEELANRPVLKDTIRARLPLGKVSSDGGPIFEGRRGRVSTAKAKLQQVAAPAPTTSVEEEVLEAPEKISVAREDAAAGEDIPMLRDEEEMRSRREEEEIRSELDDLSYKSEDISKESVSFSKKKKAKESFSRKIFADKDVKREEERKEERYSRRRQEEENARRRAEEEELRRQEEIRRKIETRRKEVEDRKQELLKQKDEIDRLAPKEGAIVAPHYPSLGVVSGADVLDFTQMPNELDSRLEKLDVEGALRPTIINVGKVWEKRTQKNLLAARQHLTLSTDQQKLEKQTCMDLLDALTKSGGLGVEGATLHVVVASTHCFGKSVLETLVQDNVNPIERVERSELIVASVVYGKEPRELLKPKEADNVLKYSPGL